jgi:hypothetical protein
MNQPYPIPASDHLYLIDLILKVLLLGMEKQRVIAGILKLFIFLRFVVQ